MKDFKKIHEDENMAVLQHARGHVIKIAKKAISPQMMEELDAVPHYQDGGDVEEDASFDLPQLGEQQQLPADLSNVISSPQQSDQYQNMSQQMPVEPSTAEIPMAQSQQPPQSMSGNLLNDVEQMKSATKGKAKVEETSQLGVAQSLQKTAADMSEINKQQQQESIDHFAENQKLMDDIKNQHVDPSRYIGSMSTTSKVATAIGLLLGGIGAGLTHGENYAAKFLEKSINDDIEAQKADIGKKKSLLSENMVLFKDKNDALNMTKANMLSIAKMEIDSKTAMAQSQSAKYVGQMESAKLQMQIDQLIGPVQQKENTVKAMKNGQIKDPSEVVATLVPQHAQDKVFGEIKAAQYVNQNKDNLESLWKNSQKEQTLFRTGAGLLKESNSRAALKAALLPVLHARGIRPTPDVLETIYDGLLPKSGELDSSQKVQWDQFQNFLDSEKNSPISKGYGIDLERFPTTATSQDIINKRQMAEYARATGDHVMLRKLGLE